MDNNRKTMNKREIFMGHAYVFLFFFLTTVACCLVIFMWNSDFKMFEQKEFVKIKMNRIKDFQQEQAESQLPVDSLFRDRPAYVLPTPRAVARCRNGNPVSVTEPLPEENQIPIVGTVAAGTPILAEECIEDYLTFDTAGRPGEYFALRVRGESMLNAGILPGDLVVVHSQPTAQHGEIVVALIDDEATVKRLSLKSGQVWLLPENEAYSPIDGTYAQILGKVAAVVRRY